MCYQKVLLMLVLAVIGLRLSERLLRCTRKMNTHSREEKAQEETLHFFFWRPNEDGRSCAAATKCRSHPAVHLGRAPGWVKPSLLVTRG